MKIEPFKMSNLVQIANITENGTGVLDLAAQFGPQRDSLYIVLPVTIIYGAIFLTGLIGNLFTCFVIVWNKNMHTATNYYLFSLAASDLLLLVSGLPQEMYIIWWRWPYNFGYTFCILRGLAAETSSNASVLTITLFTVERYLAICKPFVSHKMSKLSRAVKHIVILWIISFLLSLPPALEFGIRETSAGPMCLQIRTIINHSFEISTFMFFFTPMLVISTLYILIGLKLRESQKNNDKGEDDCGTRMRSIRKKHLKNIKSTKKIVKMLVSVVVAFFVCWAPFHAQRLVYIYGANADHSPRSKLFYDTYVILTYISGVFFYMSTCINPILYHIMSKKFRDAFKNTIGRCCKVRTRSAKRCSYTAVFVTPHQQNSSGTENSGNSGSGKGSINYKIRTNQGSCRSSKEGTQEIKLCDICSKNVAMINSEMLTDFKRRM